jgi:hypothetical protein
VIDRPVDTNGLIVLAPVLDDWEAVSLVLPRLDRELAVHGLRADVILVDDGSMAQPPSSLRDSVFTAIEHVDVLSLRRNLGHQRAIAVGLSYIEANRPCRAVVIMDADGEDDPGDVPRLVRQCETTGSQKIIFAQRTRRSESLLFRFFYQMYRFLHVVLTGIRVQVGNFSVIPASALKRLVVVSELWNHYAAAAYKARLPIGLLPTPRGRRLVGKSRMNLVALVVHGLSAMAVFGDRIGVRLLIAAGVGMSLVAAALTVVVGIRFVTALAIPGWATFATGLLLVLLFQMLLVAMVLAFVVLAGRDTASVLPCRDYVHFVSHVQRVYGCES